MSSWVQGPEQHGAGSQIGHFYLARTGHYYLAVTANVYADLGYVKASEMQRKSSLAAEIDYAINARGLTHDAAARLLGVGESLLAKILRGQFRDVDESLLGIIVEKLSSSKDST